MTAHSRFRIPINVNEDSLCTIASDSDLAGLLRNTDLIIWDEAPMLHRHCFEAFERTLRDIVDPENSSMPFGGKVVVFRGDFRQILPVINKGQRQDIVNASLNSSNIWQYCSVLQLTKNMRLNSGIHTNDIESIKEFADWILQIGEGNLGGPNHGEAEIEFPNNFLLKSNGDHVESISNFIYPSINDNLYDLKFLQERAILALTNEEVECINDFMISKIDGEEISYYSSDSICLTEGSDTFEESLQSHELLNSIKVSGFSNHKLTLKVGVTIMMFRNLEQSKGLCNGTRLQVTRLGAHVVEAKIIAGKNVGHITYIPRLKMIPSKPTIPFKFQRR